MNIIKLVQGSKEWHEHRAQYRNASETAAVLGVSPWLTPLQLWELQTGRTQPRVNAAMARGTQLEPLARGAYEQLTGNIAKPKVLVDGQYSASLDGLSFDGSLAVEIKCPVKGKTSTLWQQVSQKTIPEHYGWQIQHQLMVSQAQVAHLFIFDESGQRLLMEVLPQPDQWDKIHQGWNQFMTFIETDTPPPLSEKDKRVRTDPAWQLAAENYRHLKRKADELAEQLDQTKAELIQLAEHASETGNGVTVTKFWKQGSVDYKKVPELQGLKLDAYRGKGRLETRITIS
jgi:putative phage-type endonuclease